MYESTIGSESVFDSVGESNVNGIGINPADFIILNNSVFENFILSDEPFAKDLRIFETCVSVNNNLCGKLVSSLEVRIKFDEKI